jgi:hypothetical protein
VNVSSFFFPQAVQSLVCVHVIDVAVVAIPANTTFQIFVQNRRISFSPRHEFLTNVVCGSSVYFEEM